MPQRPVACLSSGRPNAFSSNAYLSGASRPVLLSVSLTPLAVSAPSLLSRRTSSAKEKPAEEGESTSAPRRNSVFDRLSSPRFFPWSYKYGRAH